MLVLGGPEDSKPGENFFKGVLGPPLLIIMWLELGMGNMDGSGQYEWDER